MSPGDDLDLLNPPASRPTWATLAYAVAIVLGITVLVQWPSILRLLGN